jgi:hypothetical protein
VSLTPAETDIRAVRVCQTAALMVPCSLLAAQPGMAGVFGFGAAMVLLVVTWRPRLRRMTPLEEALAQLFLLAAITGLFAVAARGTGERAAFGRYLTVGMLALALPRAAFIPTPAARAGTLAFGLLALMGMARSVGPITFGAATGAYLMAALAAVVQADPGIGPLARHPRGLLLPFGLAGALALGIMGLLGWGLPAAEPVVTEYLEPYLGDGETGTSGFSDGNVRLDRLREIQTSDEVVLRLEGAPLNRLRGQVYRQYHGAVWHPVAATTPLRFAGRDGRLPLLPGEASAPRARPDAGGGRLRSGGPRPHGPPRDLGNRGSARDHRGRHRGPGARPRGRRRLPVHARDDRRRRRARCRARSTRRI